MPTSTAPSLAETALTCRLTAAALYVGTLLVVAASGSSWGAVVVVAIAIPALVLFVAMGETFARGGRIR